MEGNEKKISIDITLREVHPAALEALEKIAGKENLAVDEATRKMLGDNSTGLSKQVLGVIYPSSREQVREIVSVANKYRIPLYPLSTGKNTGYGDRTPPRDRQLVVDLSRMNRIIEYDPDQGHVVIEPGVTQKQLYDFLQKEKSGAGRWMLDVTGAGPGTSIIGNTLEGGFGHTPLGDRRKELSGLEVVLGNGMTVRAGDFPNIGPDLNGIFVQSNFGIVTSAKINLYRTPERFESFRATTAGDSGLEGLMECVRNLRQRGLANSLVHIADPVRMLVTIGVPDDYHAGFTPGSGNEKKNLLTPEDASRMLKQRFFQSTFWTALGGVYGTKAEVSAKKKAIRKALHDADAKVMFFSDEKIKLISYLGRAAGFTRFGRDVQKAMKDYRELQNFMQGIPSALAEDNIGIERRLEDVGLLWVSPTFSADGASARKVYATASAYFRKYGFELPLTMTLVRPNKAVGIMNIKFDKSDLEETKRAHMLYSDLVKEFGRQKIFTYRTSILGMEEELIVPSPENWQVYSALKKALDPNGIIAPGRYRIS